MEINKILSEQLNLNALNPFTTTNVEGVNDNAENSEMSVNPDVAEVSEALNVQDENASLNFDNINLAKLDKSSTNINSMMNFMSNQVQNQENKENQIEEEITKKQEEYQKLAEDIQEKQEEYESLVKQAESEQDQTIAEQATALGEEINFMVSNLESIKTSIDNLETNLKTQENLTSTLKQTSQTISKTQNQITKETTQTNAVNQTTATNQVSATDAVGDVGEVEKNNNSTENSATNNIDWSALMVDGKGINVANIAKVLFDSAEKVKNNKGKSNVDDTILNILTNGTEEERNAISKLLSYPTTNKNYNILRKANDILRDTNKMGSEADILTKLASCYDKDGDGFLSDTEIENMSKNKYGKPTFGLQKDGVTMASCGELCHIKFDDYGTTTINGQKCYYIDELVLTEEEFQALDEYYTKNGPKASFSGALEAMKIEDKEYIQKGVDTTLQKDYFNIKGASDITSSIQSFKRYGKKETHNLEDSKLWYLYMGIKYANKNRNN